MTKNLKKLLLAATATTAAAGVLFTSDVALAAGKDITQPKVTGSQSGTQTQPNAGGTQTQPNAGGQANAAAQLKAAKEKAVAQLKEAGLSQFFIDQVISATNVDSVKSLTDELLKGKIKEFTVHVTFVDKNGKTLGTEKKTVKALSLFSADAEAKKLYKGAEDDLSHGVSTTNLYYKVKKDDATLTTIDDWNKKELKGEIKEAEDKVANAKKALDTAKANYDLVKDVYGSTSDKAKEYKDKLDKAQTAYDAAVKTLNEKKTALAKLNEGTPAPAPTPTPAHTSTGNALADLGVFPGEAGEKADEAGKKAHKAGKKAAEKKATAKKAAEKKAAEKKASAKKAAAKKALPKTGAIAGSVALMGLALASTGSVFAFRRRK